LTDFADSLTCWREARWLAKQIDRFC